MKPECFGKHKDTLKCLNCPSNSLCIKEVERELRFRNRQKENAEILIDSIKNYNLYHRKKSIPHIIMDKRGRIREE